MKHPLVLFTLATCVACSVPLRAAPKITTAAGANPDSIQSVVDAFRAQFGPNRGTGPGPFATGFRTINWDGVPDSAAQPNATPGDFFNSVALRGIVFNTPGAAVITSARPGNPSNIAPFFAGIDPSYATAFQAFTQDRIFTPVLSTIVDATFFVPSSPTTPASVNGFGVVFCDVDVVNSATIECFGPDGKSLGVFAAPPANNCLSFVGVIFDNGERVVRVRITHGSLTIGLGHVDNVAAGADVVVADDYMYGEPVPLKSDSRLSNVSVRGQVGGSAGKLFAGFVIEGTQAKSVLVRGIGPTLTRYSVSDAVADPSIAVFNGLGDRIFANNDWGDSLAVSQAAAEVGAFALPANSLDAAGIVVLKPGVYTLQVSAESGTGQALGEVYEIR